MPQLDGLRALAIFAVFISHFVRAEQLPLRAGVLPWGSLGVWLFFVLSGFLITGILLDARPAPGSTHARWSTLRQFFIRRFLRIFPLYYLVVFGALVVNMPHARENALWLLTYTTNLYVSFNNQWIGHLSHLWSLAIEEQFYLVWPFLVLFVPRHRLWPVIAMVAGSAPLYRLAAQYLGFNELAVEVFTVSCLDCLGAGALLAVAVRSSLATVRLRRWLFGVALPLGLTLGAVILAIRSARHGESLFKVLFPEAVILVFVPMVFAASSGTRLTRWLEWAPLRYIGKISYGLYLLHLLMPVIFQPLYASAGISHFEWEGELWAVRSPLYFLLSVTLTTTLAAVSWHCIEKPINNLKRFFPYQRGAGTESRTPPSKAPA